MNLLKTVLVSVFFAGACFAQEDKNATQEVHFYRLDYVVQEVDQGQVVNSRNYSVMIASGHVSETRTGDKVPYKTEKGSDYLDVGVNIDSRRPREVGNEVAVEVSAEISSLAPGQTTSGDLPLLRQNRWQSDVLLPLRKPVVIFSSDDPASRHKLQLEVTATLIR